MKNFDTEKELIKEKIREIVEDFKDTMENFWILLNQNFLIL